MDVFALIVERYGLLMALLAGGGWVAYLQLLHLQAKRHRNVAQAAEREQIDTEREDLVNQFGRLIVASFQPLMVRNQELQTQVTTLAVSQAKLQTEHKHLADQHKSSSAKLTAAQMEAAHFKALASDQADRIEEIQDELETEQSARAEAVRQHAELMQAVSMRITNATEPLSRRIRDLENTIAEKDRRIAELTAQLNDQTPTNSQGDTTDES